MPLQKQYLLILLLCLLLCGCGYPAVSPTTYQLSKALYSACNRQSDEQLTKVDVLIQASFANGEMTEREKKWLTTISNQAHAGEWKSASLEARRLLEDQVR